MSDQRFWPIKPKPGEQPVFRKAQSWQEAAIIAREMCMVVDAGKALSDRSYSQHEGGGKGKKGDGKGPGGPGPKKLTRAERFRQKRQLKKQQKEQVLLQTGGPSEDGKCKVCGLPGHPAALCPQKAADKRGETQQLLAEFKKTGACCNLCAGLGLKVGGHRGRHHSLAAADHYGTGGGGKDSERGKSKGKKGKKGEGAGGKSADGKKPCYAFKRGNCKFGTACRFSHEVSETSQVQQEPPQAPGPTANGNGNGGGNGKKKEECWPLFENGMDQIFQQGERRQALHFRGMKKLPREFVTKGPAPMVGYNCQTRLLCGLDEQLVLLDNGASCGTIPEWKFGEIYEQVASRIS